MNIASFKNRITAFLIDLIIIYLIAYGILLSLGIRINLTNLGLIAGFFSILYFFFMWRLNSGRTIGMLCQKIRVRMVDGSELDNNKLFLRAMLLAVVVAPIHGVFLLAVVNILVSYGILKNPKENRLKQTIWDKVTDTVVVFQQ